MYATYQFNATMLNLTIIILDFIRALTNCSNPSIVSPLATEMSSTENSISSPLTFAIFFRITTASFFFPRLISHLGDSGIKLNKYITSVFHWNVTIWLVMKWSHDYKRDVLHPNKTQTRNCTCLHDNIRCKQSMA